MTQPSRKPMSRILGTTIESVAFSLADRTMTFVDRVGLLSWLQLKHDFKPLACQTVITTDETNSYSVTGTGVDTLIPPVSGPVAGPNGGYYKTVGYTLSSESLAAGFTVVDDAIVFPESGYYLADGWLNFRHSSNSSTVSVIFGVEKANNPGTVFYSARPTAMNTPNNNRLGLLSGGGALGGVEPGDKLTIWIASDNTGTVIVPNASLRVWKHSDS